MAKLLTPKLLLRGFGFFVLASAAGFIGVLIYGDNLGAFFRGLASVHWGWVLVGLALASADWFGGGFRLWVIARQLMPNPSLKGTIMAGGMSAFAAAITPFQSGAAPMMIYAMRRYGIPLSVAATCTLMGFVGTVGFFAIAGPIAVLAGAGQSLGTRGDLFGLSLYDLFLGSLSIFAGIGVFLIVVMVFPSLIRNLLQKLAGRLGRNRPRWAHRVKNFQEGIEEAHSHLLTLNSPRGWLAIALCTILSGVSHANKLLAGYVALRAVGIHVNFVDVLLLQTLITFLLYFAPTPGGSGIAEVMSTAVMAIYVPKAVLPLYTLIWRLILSWYTVAFGAMVFSRWVQQGLKGIAMQPTAEPVPVTGNEGPA